MLIALDFDGTYTKDPLFWDRFLVDAKGMGHIVYCVTFRRPTDDGHEVTDALIGKVKEIHFTSGTAKRRFMQDQEIYIDVWIDDQPELVAW